MKITGEIKVISHITSENICKNLLGALPSDQLKELHATISESARRLDTLLFELQQAVHCKKDEIFRAHVKWDKDLTTDPYPVFSKAQAIPKGSARFTDVHTAQKEWMSFLANLETDCVHNKIPYWKRI